MSDDLREAMDDTLGDMAAHQRRFSGEVTASQNQTLAAEAFARLEREQADARPVTPQPAPAPAAATERRDGKHGSYVVSKSPTDDVRVRLASTDEHMFIQRSTERLMFLLTKKETGPLGQPSWSQQVEALLQLRSQVPGARIAGLHDYAANLEKRFAFELAELLEASSVPFGDWRAEASHNPLVGWRASCPV